MTAKENIPTLFDYKWEWFLSCEQVPSDNNRLQYIFQWCERGQYQQLHKNKFCDLNFSKLSERVYRNLGIVIEVTTPKEIEKWMADNGVVMKGPKP